MGYLFNINNTYISTKIFFFLFFFLPKSEDIKGPYHGIEVFSTFLKYPKVVNFFKYGSKSSHLRILQKRENIEQFE